MSSTAQLQALLYSSACFLVMLRPSSAFPSIVILGSHPSQRWTANGFAFPNKRATSPLNAEFGELSISQPPRLDDDLIRAARAPLPWESVYDRDDDSSCWQNGQRWFETRASLTKLWVLPRDMSNGSWENYAAAADEGERKILERVPQLLRLESSLVVESARTVLRQLKLPPALLRREPILLAMEPARLRGGYDRLKKTMVDESKLREACRDTPGLLAETAARWSNTTGLGP